MARERSKKPISSELTFEQAKELEKMTQKWYNDLKISKEEKLFKRLRSLYRFYVLRSIVMQVRGGIKK